LHFAIQISKIKLFFQIELSIKFFADYKSFSILALWSNWQQKSFKGIISIVVLILSISVLYFGKVTGTTGGEIRHTEIRANQALGNQPSNGTSVNSDQEEEDED
jgi:hypothetical protein